MNLPTPHYDKLVATLQNEKLPSEDKSVLQQAVVRYGEWVSNLRAVQGSSVEEVVNKMVALLNDYRLFLDVEVIFDRQADFLYRQKGQTKLDNSVIEEFLPHLVCKCMSQVTETSGLAVGPNTTFSATYFASSLNAMTPGGGLTVRAKDQDFAIARTLYLRASHNPDFKESVERSVFLGYVVAECKTNLDKTMFQEACATAHDAKSAVTGAKYYLLCEFLDMTPQSTAATDIDEVLILRKAKRISSNVRSAFGTAAGRSGSRDMLVSFLKANPFRPEMFLRFIKHIAGILTPDPPKEKHVLDQGYF
jgi:hypothetical protein